MPGATPDYWLYRVPATRVHWLCKAAADRAKERDRIANPKRFRPDDPRIHARERWKRIAKHLAP